MIREEIDKCECIVVDRVKSIHQGGIPCFSESVSSAELSLMPRQADEHQIRRSGSVLEPVTTSLEDGSLFHLQNSSNDRVSGVGLSLTPRRHDLPTNRRSDSVQAVSIKADQKLIGDESIECVSSAGRRLKFLFRGLFGRAVSTPESSVRRHAHGNRRDAHERFRIVRGLTERWLAAMDMSCDICQITQPSLRGKLKGRGQENTWLSIVLSWKNCLDVSFFPKSLFIIKMVAARIMIRATSSYGSSHSRQGYEQKTSSTTSLPIIEQPSWNGSHNPPRRNLRVDLLGLQEVYS